MYHTHTKTVLLSSIVSQTSTESSLAVTAAHLKAGWEIPTSIVATVDRRVSCLAVCKTQARYVFRVKMENHHGVHRFQTSNVVDAVDFLESISALLMAQALTH
jgi:hypothetical protein